MTKIAKSHFSHAQKYCYVCNGQSKDTDFLAQMTRDERARAVGMLEVGTSIRHISLFINSSCGTYHGQSGFTSVIPSYQTCEWCNIQFQWIFNDRYDVNRHSFTRKDLIMAYTSIIQITIPLGFLIFIYFMTFCVHRYDLKSKVCLLYVSGSTSV